MTEDEKLVAREEAPRFGNFLGSDGGDGAASFLFGFAAQKDFGGRLEAAEKWHGSPIAPDFTGNKIICAIFLCGEL